MGYYIVLLDDDFENGDAFRTATFESLQSAKELYDRYPEVKINSDKVPDDCCVISIYTVEINENHDWDDEVMKTSEDMAELRDLLYQKVIKRFD